MKRIFAVLMTLAVATALHATDLSISGSIDMALIPFQLVWNDEANEDEYEFVMGSGIGRNASGQGPRARLDMRVSNEELGIGMRTRLQVRTDGFGVEDFLQAWWTPFSWLRFDAGRFHDDRLRGRFNDLDERMHAYTVRMHNADAIFSRFNTHWTGQAGVMVGLTPPVPALENLWVGALLYGLVPFSAASGTGAIFDSTPDMITDNTDVWQRMQVAIAYEIPGVGLFRTQFFGARPYVDIRVITDERPQIPYTYRVVTFGITAPRIEAAFAFTGIEGLVIDVGGKVPLAFRDWSRPRSNIFDREDEADITDPLYLIYRRGHIWQAPYQVSIGASYRIGILELAGRADASFGGSLKGHYSERHFAPELNLHFWPTFHFDAFRLTLNVGYEWIGETVDRHGNIVGIGEPRALVGGHRLGFGVSAQRNFMANAFVRAGVAYRLAGTVNGVRERAVLTIPLHMEFMF